MERSPRLTEKREEQIEKGGLMGQYDVHSKGKGKATRKEYRQNDHTTNPDLTTIKGRLQKAWSSGDYGRVGVTILMSELLELLAEAVDLKPGQRVLDVASSNGNASLAAARRFCEVVGIDYVPMLVEEGRKRAEAEGLTVDFREGDAEDLPFEDTSFDVVLSTLGVIFTPRPAESSRRALQGVQAWR